MSAVAVAKLGSLPVERERLQLPATGGTGQHNRLLSQTTLGLTFRGQMAPADRGAKARQPAGRSEPARPRVPRRARDRVGRAGLAVDRQRIIGRPEEASAATTQRRASSAEFAASAAANCQLRNRDIARQSSSAAAESREHCPQVRKVGALRRPDIVVAVWLIGLPAGQRVIDHRRVVAVAMAHRTNQGILVRHGRQPRKMLADLHAGHTGRDGTKRPAIFGRRVGLQVEHVEVGRPAEQVDQDARLGLACLGSWRR